MEDEFVTAFSDEEADELDSRMTRGMGGLGGLDPHARSKSMLRYNELERERSNRRQNIVKNKTKNKLFPGRLKLSMMNTGLIPIKRGKSPKSEHKSKCLADNRSGLTFSRLSFEGAQK